MPEGGDKTDLSPMVRAWMAMQSAASAFRQTWNARDFGPQPPLMPRTAPDSTEQQSGPRQFQYPVAANLIPRPRQEIPNLTPFDQLRTLSRMYDVAAICINTRIEEVCALPWMVVARDSSSTPRMEGAIDSVTEFFKYPDGETEWSSWLAMLLRDVLEIDALTLYKRLDKRGRLLGLDVIDGSTIKPLIDPRGRTVAYQQILYGYPYSQYGRSDDPEGQAFLDEASFYAPHQLIYRPRFPKPDSPYGTPAIEDLLTSTNTAVRKRLFDMAYFTDGNTPEGFFIPKADIMTPEQIREFERDFNAELAGNDQARRRLKYMIMDGQVINTKPFSYETHVDLFLLKLTCARYGVPPTEIGFTDDVNRATARNQGEVNTRRGLKPLALWLKGLFDRIIQRDLGQVALEWQFDLDDVSTPAQYAQQAAGDSVYLQAGVLSPLQVQKLRFSDLEDDAPDAAAAAQPGDTPEGAPRIGPGTRGGRPTNDSGAGDAAGEIGAALVPADIAKRRPARLTRVQLPDDLLAQAAALYHHIKEES